MSYIGTNKVGKMYLGNTDIGKAYLGSTLVYNSQSGEVPEDDTYLVAYWDGSDAPVGGNWVDRIGNKRYQLVGTYTNTNGYYEFLNTSSHANYAKLLDTNFGLQYEMKVVCKFVLNANSSNSTIVFDFGGYGPNSAHWGFGTARTTGGGWFLNTKYNGNTGVSESKTGTAPVFTNGTWTDGTISAGIELSEGQQRAFLRIGGYERLSALKSKLTINAWNDNLCFLARPVSNAMNYYTKIRIKSIKVYSKV